MNICSINEHYGIGSISEITPISDQRGFLINTDRGSFIFRPLKFLSRTQKMFYEDSFTNYLADCGYPAQQFIKTLRGSLLCNIDNETYFMSKYFAGAFKPNNQVKLSPPQLCEAGFQLARLHLLSKAYSGPTSQKLPLRSEKAHKVLRGVLTYLSNKGEFDDFDIVVGIVTKKKLSYITKHPFEKQDFLLQPSIMNHGDYHAGNIVFDSNDHITGVLDFEYCTLMPRLWDIAWSLTWLCSETPTEAFSGRLDLERSHILLSSYNSTYPLSHDEQILLNNLYVSACYHSTYFLEHYYLKSLSPRYLHQCKSVGEWLWGGENTDILQEVITNACYTDPVQNAEENQMAIYKGDY